MANEVGTAYVGVEFSKQAINGALAMLQGELTGGLGRIGKLLPKGAIGVGIAGAVAGAGVLIGKELFDIGKEFAQARDTIRTETGASGKHLEDLANVTARVFRKVPESLDEVATATSRVSIRLGGNQKQLENLTTKYVELARVTHSEVGPIIEATSKSFNVWGLNADQASRGLDKFFVASQKTGTSVSEIAGTVQRFARPLQGLGFTFEQAASLAATFSKEGLNTTKVMGGLVIGLGNIAKEGKNPVTAFDALSKKIRSAHSTMEALQIAIPVFGKRAAVDLVGALRNGAGAADELGGSMRRSRGKIHEADEASKHFHEHWTEFVHKLKTDIRPAAETFFNWLSDEMDAVNKKLPQMEKELGNQKPRFEELGAAIKQAQPVWSRALDVAFAPLREVKKVLLDMTASFTVAGGIIGTVSALVHRNWSDALDGVKQTLRGAGDVGQTVVKMFGGPFAALVPILKQHGRAMVAGFVAGVTGAAGSVASAAAAVKSRVVSTFRDAVAWIRANGGALLTGFANGVRGAYNAVTSAVAAVRGRVTAAVSGAVGWIKNAGTALATGFVQGVRAGYKAVTGAAAGLRGAARAAVGGARDWLYNAGIAVAEGVARGIRAGKGAVEAAAGELASLAHRAFNWVSKIRSPSLVMHESGLELARGVATGIKAGSPEAEKAARELAQRTLKAARDVVKAAAGSLSQALSDAFSGLQSAQQTQSEQALATLQAQHDAAARQQALADAQAQLAAAQTADEATSAQRAVDDAQYAILVASLEQSAAVERKALDDQQRAQQLAFDSRVKGLVKYLESNRATVAGSRKQIAKLLKDFGVDFETVGEQVGKSFVTGLEKASAAIDKALANLRKKTGSGGSADGYTQVGGSSYSAGVAQAAAPSLRTGVGATSAGGGGIAGTVTPAQRLARALAGVAASAAGEATPSLEGLALHVYIGDQELRGLVRSEVVRNDTGIARTLLAGAR